MLGETNLKKIAQKILKLSTADQTEILIMGGTRGLTRFANSQIHQNVAEEGTLVQVRAVVNPSTPSGRSGRPSTKASTELSRISSGRGAKIGVASTNDLSLQGLVKVVEKASNMAKLSKVDPHFVFLPTASKIKKIKQVLPKLELLTPSKKAKIVGDVIKIAKSEKLTASGAFDSSLSEIAVANSEGVWNYHAGLQENLQTVLIGKNSTGFAQNLGSHIGKIDHKKLAKRAVSKALESKNPTEIEAGDYEVILESPAVAEMMLFFSYLGPNARIYHEEASFLTGKLGQKLFSEKLTVHDDPLHPETIIAPFDYEGHPKSRLTIIDKGVFANIVYDSYHAAKHGGKNTGHALPAPNTEGPIATHLVFEPGNVTIDEMVKNVKKGILVTRFWYVRMLHHRLLNITGMTRDGTFLVENGQIVAPVKNMRFTQSIPEALANVVNVGKELKLEEGWGGANLVPALHISKFHFSGVTKF